MSTASFVAVLVIGLASYRVTRLIVEDTLLDEPRGWVLRHLAPRPKISNVRNGFVVEGSRFPGTRRKISEGLQCSFCVGVWVTAGLAALWHWTSGGRGLVIVAAICGLQALLSSWE